jgi:hypothetical protein
MNRHDRRMAKAQARRQRDMAGMVPFGPYLKVPGPLLDPCVSLLAELANKAAQQQPPFAEEFSQRAAALHEASHCVVAAREGFSIETAAIERQPDGQWEGATWINIGELRYDGGEPFLAHLRYTLAGRRGELLFTDPFCLRAGLDELAYAQLMIMIPHVKEHRDGMHRDHYLVLWGSKLAEVDDTLRAHSDVAHTLADRLMRSGRLQRGGVEDALPKHSCPHHPTDVALKVGAAGDRLRPVSLGLRPLCQLGVDGR